MSGAFSVPDWDATAAPSTSFQFNKKKLKARNKKKSIPQTSNQKQTPKKTATPLVATVPGQFVLLNRTAKPSQPSSAKKRKQVDAPIEKLSSTKDGAKKRKLEKNSSKQNQNKNSKTVQPKARAHDKYAHKKANADFESVTKKTPFTKNKSEKFVKKVVKPVSVKPVKKAAKVRPSKKLELADEESDSELATEVNKFRKQLLKGFSGPKESSGNDEISFSDNEDLDLSDSDDEPKPKKKVFEKTEKEDKKVATKKPVAKDDDDPDEEQQPPAEENSFRNKLIGNLKGSRFRYLNEILYTSEGTNAVKLFKQDRAAFSAYHDGYRQQVEQWPLNPLDRIIKSIKKLPKTLVIADFGCGEGRLAKAVPQKTYSLDLVAQRHEIIACDMAKTPLETNSIDVAVYCLSLMGTNLKDFVLEANRVLKANGLLKIAEVESRFDDVRQFVENIKSCGFQHVNTDSSSKFFVFINFKKVRNVEKGSKQVPSFSLKPCLYKKR